jgi:hypothetical protein
MLATRSGIAAIASARSRSAKGVVWSRHSDEGVVWSHRSAKGVVWSRALVS